MFGFDLKKFAIKIEIFDNVEMSDISSPLILSSKISTISIFRLDNNLNTFFDNNETSAD